VPKGLSSSSLPTKGRCQNRNTATKYNLRQDPQTISGIRIYFRYKPMHSPLHRYLRDLIQGGNDCALYTLECDHAGGHEVCRCDHMSSALNASFASIKDPSFRESNRARVYQCAKIENSLGSEENKSRKVQLSCAPSSDRSLASRGSANTLIHRRRRSGRQSRYQTSPQARSQKRAFRAFGAGDDSVPSLVVSTSQPMLPSSPPMMPSSPPMSPSSPRSVMDAFSSSDTTDNVHRHKLIRAVLKINLSW
jgi:hypothetical protein